MDPPTLGASPVPLGGPDSAADSDPWGAPAEETAEPGPLRQVHPSYVTVSCIATMITTAILVLGLTGACVFAWLSAWPVALQWVTRGFLVLTPAVLIPMGLWWPGRAFARLRYRLGTEGLEIQRGVIWRSTLFVPRSRVQHTDISQGPLERRFGLASLIVHTAGSENASVQLPGLPNDEALSLRDQLLSVSPR